MVSVEQSSQFIVDRSKARPHFSFGSGIHRCMGNRLAELQLRVLWGEIVKRFSFVEVEVVDEPERTYSTFVKGYPRMLVKLHPK
ncbi:MAG: cytochrome P450 [Pseudomonadales bacterium]